MRLIDHHKWLYRCWFNNFLPPSPQQTLDMSHELAPQQLPGHGVPHLHSTVSVAIDRYLAISTPTSRPGDSRQQVTMSQTASAWRSLLHHTTL